MSGAQLPVYSVSQVNGYLKELVDGELVDAASAEIVPAGGESVEDSVITGSMNYFVEGVVSAN